MSEKPPLEPAASDFVYPPSDFNLIENAFRPTATFSPVPGLEEKVKQLLGETRLRSALDEVFKVLADEPQNEHALRLAMEPFRSRTQELRAKEPLTVGNLAIIFFPPVGNSADFTQYVLTRRVLIAGSEEAAAPDALEKAGDRELRIPGALTG
jgi:hypothetical protein